MPCFENPLEVREGTGLWKLLVSADKACKTQSTRKPCFSLFSSLQACDPGLSRTCDQNTYLSGLCYLFPQSLEGPMLQNRPAYQGEELETQWVKIPLRSWFPQEPAQQAKLLSVRPVCMSPLQNV